MKYLFTTITVQNIEESLRFYTWILSLRILRRFSPREGINIAFLQGEDGNQIELIQNDLEAAGFAKGTKSNVQIGFGVEKLDDTIKFLKQELISIKRGPMPIPNGRFIVIEDPNGVDIGLYEEI
jgi:lactoylglutathione lyase